MLLHYVKKELRSLYRDKQVLVYGLLLPLFLYPFLLFGISQIKLYTSGLQERVSLRAGIVAGLEGTRLNKYLEEHGSKNLELSFFIGDKAKQLRDGKLDLVLFVNPRSLNIQLEYDSSMSSSLHARDQILPLLEDYGLVLENRQSKRPANSTGKAPEIIEFNVTDPNRRSQELMALILPLILIVMCTFGATYPALELTAGEKEQRCSETTFLLPISRNCVALGKTIAVTICSFQAVVVNLLAMLFTAGPLLIVMEGGQAALPSLAWYSLPLIAFFGLLLSLLFGSAFLLVGSYAKNYREAQAYVTPLQILAVAPAILTILPGGSLNLVTALIPVYNVGLVIRSALIGDVDAKVIIACLCSTGLLCYCFFRATVMRLSSASFALGFKDPDAKDPDVTVKAHA